MRQDSLTIQNFLESASVEPRFVVGIIYPTSSPYFTSRTGLSNVPGVAVQGVLQDIGGTTQEINPDEGRATIGSISFKVVDIASDMTDELRSQLTSNDRGPRRREVRVFMGFTDDFNDYIRIATQQIEDVQLVENVYDITCADVQRQMRDEIFLQKKTRLTADLTAAATVVTVDDTTDFSTVAHTAAFTDAPSSTVGYIRIRKSGEIIRYTGKTATTFTGCTRGVFNTVATALDIDTTKELDQQPLVEEFIYLELPGPELAYALLTGVIRSSGSPADTLPAHWHVGIDESLVDGNAFDNIGRDLVDASDATAGLVFRFTHLEATDGKQFIEKQLMVPMGTYMPINVNGVLGLKKFARILTDAPQAAQLDETNVVSSTGIHHDQRSVINQIQLDWNYNGDDFTRRTFVQDNNSINRNGAATVKKIELRGIAITRHTSRSIDRIVRTIADRYGEPPERMEVRVLPSLSALEVGDVVRVDLDRLRDYQGTGTLDRSFEIQQTQINWRTGQVTLRLFGTSREVPQEQPSGSAVPLPDGWYTSTGTNLTSVLTISGDAVTVNGTLNGDTDMTAAGAIFYYDGNLTINTGITVTINDNVQLRIKGTLTINGDIDGNANGLAGVLSPNTVGLAVVTTIASYLGTPGYLGTTRGGDGLLWVGSVSRWQNRSIRTAAIGTHNAAAVLDIEVTGSLDSPVSASLLGIPSDCRGTSGGPGLAIEDSDFTVEYDGGDGGDGGAGLVIVCRGLAFGVSGFIDLSGGPGSLGSQGALGGTTVQAGVGSGGAPGALYVLLDGNGVTYPDLSGGNLVANRGNAPYTGNPATYSSRPFVTFTAPGMGVVQGLPGLELHWQSASQIQYIPVETDATDAEDDVVPAPTSLTIQSDGDRIIVTIDHVDARHYDSVEIFASTDNDRSNATLVADGIGHQFIFAIEGVYTRYFWARRRKGSVVSDWYPLSSTAGVLGTGGYPIIPPISLGNVYHETFDGYTSEDDFLREWEILTGTPTITFPQGGVSGGRILKLDGACKIRSRRNIPLEFAERTLYRLETRLRKDSSTGLDVDIGFVGVKADGTTIIGRDGSSTGLMMGSLVYNSDLSEMSDNAWGREFSWFAGYHPTLWADTPAGGVVNDWRRRPDQAVYIRASNDSPVEPPAYVRWEIELSGTRELDIDYLLIDKRTDSDPGLPGLPDPNISAADDQQFWATATSFPGGVVEVGGGPTNGNALLFANMSDESQLAFSRHPIRVDGNTITFRVEYKIDDNNSPGSLSGTSQLRVALWAYEAGSVMPSLYTQVAGSANTVSLNFSTLTTDGTWNQATLTFSNVYTATNLQDADVAVVGVGYFSDSAGDDFDGRIGRVRLVQS